MTWRRLGWIEPPAGRPSWWSSHAGFPTVVSVSGNEVLLFVASRDEAQKSSCALLRIALAPNEVSLVDSGRRPLLEPGESGCFDESGVNVTYATSSHDQISVWYHGWFLRREGGWTNSIGHATGSLEDGLQRRSTAPVFDRSSDDPTSLGYPFWFNFPSGQKLFYCSYEKYGVPPLGQPYSYRVKFANGPSLVRSGPILPHLNGCQAQSRPCVVKYRDRYRMFVSVKGQHYRIESAESKDGISWEWSGDEWSLWPSGKGGETLETAYAYVFEHDSRLAMFYNGDGHGATGVGVAIWDD